MKPFEKAIKQGSASKTLASSIRLGIDTDQFRTTYLGGVGSYKSATREELPEIKAKLTSVGLSQNKNRLFQSSYK